MAEIKLSKEQIARYVLNSTDVHVTINGDEVVIMFLVDNKLVYANHTPLKEWEGKMRELYKQAQIQS